MSDKRMMKLQSFTNKELSDRTLPKKYGYTDEEINKQCFERFQVYVELGELPQFDTLSIMTGNKL